MNLHIRIPTGACVAIVAHVGHGEKDRERGAYALRGNVDFRVLVKREGLPDERRCTMFSKKMKDGPPFPPASYQAEIIDLPGVTDSEGEASSSLVMRSTEYLPQKDKKDLPQKTEQCLIILQDMHNTAARNLSDGGYDPLGARVKSTDWRDECVRKKVIKGKTKASIKAQFQNIKGTLRDNGLVLVEGLYSAPTPEQDEG